MLMLNFIIISQRNKGILDSNTTYVNVKLKQTDKFHLTGKHSNTTYVNVKL